MGIWQQAAALCVSLATDNKEGQCIELTQQRSAEVVSDLEENQFYGKVEAEVLGRSNKHW